MKAKTFFKRHQETIKRTLLNVTQIMYAHYYLGILLQRTLLKHVEVSAENNLNIP